MCARLHFCTDTRQHARNHLLLIVDDYKPSAAEQLTTLMFLLSVFTAVVPPGMEVRSGMVQECESGSYQDQWLTPSSASCTSCGEDIASDATVPLHFYTVESGANDNVTESSITVRGTPDSCCK